MLYEIVGLIEAGMTNTIEKIKVYFNGATFIALGITVGNFNLKYNS